MSTSSLPHVLAVRLDSDGDVLVTGPAIRALAAGARRVTLLCGPRGRAAAELLPGVDEVLVHIAPWIDPDPPPIDPGAIEQLVADLRALDIDESVVFTSFHQSPLPTALVLRLAGVPRIAAISDDYPGSLLDVRHRVSENLHEVERALSLAEAAGFVPRPDDDLALAVAVERVAERRPGLVVVHPGASVPARAPSPILLRDVVQRLCEAGRQVCVTGGRGERALTEFVAAAPRALDLGGLTSLRTLALLLAKADVVVCGNTGPAHLAAAVRTPVVALFAPTVPAARWRPWRVPHVLLGDQEIECAGCRARICPIPGRPCLDSLTADDVIAAVEHLSPADRDVCRRDQTGVRSAMVAGGPEP